MTYAPSLFGDNMARFANADTNSSFTLRLLGPLQYVLNINTSQWIVGIGLNQLADFTIAHNCFIINEWGEDMIANYANAILYMFINYGLIG